MRWFWFATFTLICSLLSLFFRQPLILIAELFLIDIFLTRKIKWLFWLPKTARTFPIWLNFGLWLTFTIWVIRLLAIDSITITTPAAKPLLQPGDNVLVSKINFGPRLPVFITGSSKPVVRLRGIDGFQTISRGDLIAYNFPEGDTVLPDMPTISYYSWKRKSESEKIALPANTKLRYRQANLRTPEISRCTGLPGDTVVIPGKGVNPLFLSFDYLVEVRNLQLPREFLNRLGLDATEAQVLPGLGYLLPLRPTQLAEVRLRPEVTNMSAGMQASGQGDYNIFPHDARYPWNRDNFGPVIVPHRGDSVRLTLQNLPIFRRIIEVYENNRLEIVQDKILINGQTAETYTFRQNYYFILGDNRHHSRDSRHWGFLPEDHIIGKPVLIWFSARKSPDQPFRIYWKRIFTRLN